VEGREASVRVDEASVRNEETSQGLRGLSKKKREGAGIFS